MTASHPYMITENSIRKLYDCRPCFCGFSEWSLFLLFVELYTFLLAGQHFGHIAALLTFSAITGQHFAHMVVLLTFLAPSGQHFGYIAVLLTFSALTGQHFAHLIVLLTFSALTSQHFR